MNIPFIKSKYKIDSIQDQLLNANIIYDSILEITESVDKAEEAYTDWIAARQHAGKDPYGTISLDGIGVAFALSEVFGGSNKGGSNPDIVS